MEARGFNCGNFFQGGKVSFATRGKISERWKLNSEKPLDDSDLPDHNIVSTYSN